MLIRDYQYYIMRRQSLLGSWNSEYSFISHISNALDRSKASARDASRRRAETSEAHAREYLHRNLYMGVRNNVIARWHYKQLGILLDI